MNIDLINDTIYTLETAETTLENIADLANLYIVQERLQVNNVKQELDDILPAYTEYINIKKDYQLGKVSESAVIKAIKAVCTEIREFVSTLYNCTDMNKERKIIKELTVLIYEDIQDR